MNKLTPVICIVLLLSGALGGCAKNVTSSEKVEPSKLNPANTSEASETITTGGYTYSNPNFSFSKTLPAGIKKEDIRYFDEKADETGKLQGDFTYAFVDLTIKNNSKSQEINIGNFKFVSSNENGELSNLSEEIRYQSAGSENENPKDYYWVKLAPDKSRRLNIGYIIKDENLKVTPVYYLIDSEGYGAGYNNHKMFKVDAP